MRTFPFSIDLKKWQRMGEVYSVISWRMGVSWSRGLRPPDQSSGVSDQQSVGSGPGSGPDVDACVT